MISKVEMIEELARVEVKLAMQQQLNKKAIVTRLRGKLLEDVSLGSKTNPDIKISDVIYNIMYTMNTK